MRNGSNGDVLLGPCFLEYAELLSIILKTGSAAENAVNLSQRIQSQYDLKQLSAVDMPQLMKIHGIKLAKAAQIAACFELARRLETFESTSKYKINSQKTSTGAFTRRCGNRRRRLSGAVPGYQEPGDQRRYGLSRVAQR